MHTSAPRRPSKPASFLALAALAFLLGPLCWTETARAQFHFQDFNSPHTVPPDLIKAVGACLIEAKTGRVLFERNADEHLLPASTTKLMTALIVYEMNGRNLKGEVTITSEDHAEPSNVPLVPGETISVNKLFHALLIESANDAARALGRYVAGSNEAFVGMMNQRALAMGCFNTHFANPNGLPAREGTHYTSCADLMKIFEAVIKYPELREICETREYVLHSASGTHTYRNHNLLLGYYPGMGPAKTGWTVASRHTYAASVTRDGREILLTLLDTPNKWIDAQILFNWAFAQAPQAAAAYSGAPADNSPQ